jgi:O-antigen ligase
MEISNSKKLFYFFPILFCFCLPFGSLLLSVIILCWAVNSFFVLEKEKLRGLLKNRNLWWMYLFFAGTVLSAVLSENKNEAMFAIEVKMTFLIFPYLLLGFTWPIDILKRCIVAFVSGCFFAAMFLITRALLYFFDGHPEYLFYTHFSIFIHASYFAMYLVLAIAFVFVLYPHWFKLQKAVIYSSYVFVAVFITTIFLCSSKLGIISFFLIMPVLVIYRWRQGISLKKGLIAAVVLILALLVTIKISPEPVSRLQNAFNISLSKLDKTSSESNTVRILIWEQAMVLIQDNFWTGTGVADANDALYKKYADNGLTGALEYRLNAHNQFFQTLIGMGIFGAIVLFILTFGQFIKSIFQKQILMVIFSTLIILNFMVESMLQTSAGVLFFAFFYALFSLVDSNALKVENKTLQS